MEYMKKWKALGQVFLLGCLFCCSVYATEKQDQAPTLKITSVLPVGIVNLELHNGSKGPLRIFRETNGWGAARWRVFKLRRGESETFFLTTRYILFTRNIPAFDEIQLGEKLEYRLDLNGENWFRSGEGKIGFESGDMLIVSYDVPLSEEALEEKVWWGVVSTVVTVP